MNRNHLEDPKVNDFLEREALTELIHEEDFDQKNRKLFPSDYKDRSEEMGEYIDHKYDVFLNLCEEIREGNLAVVKEAFSLCNAFGFSKDKLLESIKEGADA